MEYALMINRGRWHFADWHHSDCATEYCEKWFCRKHRRIYWVCQDHEHDRSVNWLGGDGDCIECKKELEHSTLTEKSQ